MMIAECEKCHVRYSLNGKRLPEETCPRCGGKLIGQYKIPKRSLRTVSGGGPGTGKRR